MGISLEKISRWFGKGKRVKRAAREIREVWPRVRHNFQGMLSGSTTSDRDLIRLYTALDEIVAAFHRDRR